MEWIKSWTLKTLMCVMSIYSRLIGQYLYPKDTLEWIVPKKLAKISYWYQGTQYYYFAQYSTKFRLNCINSNISINYHKKEISLPQQPGFLYSISPKSLNMNFKVEGQFENEYMNKVFTPYDDFSFCTLD